MPEFSIGLCAPAFDNEDKLYKGLSALIMRGVRVRGSFALYIPELPSRSSSRAAFDALLTVGTYDNTNDDCEQLGTLPTGIFSSLPTIRSARGPFVTVADLSSYPVGQSTAFDSFNNSIFFGSTKTAVS